MSEYAIGCEIERPTAVPDQLERLRVVRIIGKSVSLFQDAEKAYLQIESYVELKGADGLITFVILAQERTSYEGPTSAIKGLEPINFEGDTV